jgi:GNAT superfamily N-acetyltransferase
MKKEILVVDSLEYLPENPWMEITRQFENNYTVKWYSIITYVEGELVGFMHVFRNHDCDSMWYIGYVHTKQEYRRQHVAKEMYNKVFSIIKEYEKAYCIMTSIHSGNIASVKLHENMGFVNSQLKTVFAGYNYKPEETMYYYNFASMLPTVNNEMCLQQLRQMWESYMFEIEEVCTSEELERGLKARIEMASQNEKIFFERIWAGDNLIGFVFYSIDGGIRNLIPAGYGYIMELYILPEWRNKNFARYIVRDVIGKLKNLGCPKIYLTSTEKSMQFWKKMGFYESGIIDPDNCLEIYFYE